MKFLQALILIYVISVEAKGRRHGDKFNSGKAEKKHRDGSRSLAADYVRPAGQSQLSDAGSGMNHGNIAVRPPKYGHIGLNPEGEEGERSAKGENHDRLVVATNESKNEANPMKKTESTEHGDDGNGSKTKRVPSNVGEIHIESGGQGIQSRSQYGVNGILPHQYLGTGQLPSYHQSSPNQGGLYRSLFGIANQGSINQGEFAQRPAQQWGSGEVQPAVYFGFAGRSGQWGALAPHVQGQYSSSVQAPVYPRSGMNIGQGGQIGFPSMQASFSTYGQPADYYGAVLNQVGQLAGYGSAPGENSLNWNRQLIGPPQRVDLQGHYIGSSHPIATGRNISGQVGGQGGFLSWLKSLFASGTSGQSDVPISNSVKPHYKRQNPCSVGTILAGNGKCLPYCTNSRSAECVGAPSSFKPTGPESGLYRSANKSTTSKSFGGGRPATNHVLSRHISSGFYYPPPRHLNSDPNTWDPATRYYFSMPEQESYSYGGDPRRLQSSPHSPIQMYTNAFPITYSAL